MKIGVVKERAPNERRVALVPDALKSLIAAGAEILVEQGAGDDAAIPDRLFTDAGATIVSRDELYKQADVVARVQKPDGADVDSLRDGQAVVGILQPLIDPQLMERLASKKVTAISLDAIPRTLSRAQSMDVLSSQANVGGYRAVLMGAQEYGRYFPLLTTAAGTAKPANVLILGIGVAGLQAIATARRLGAIVKAYDVRSETKEQAESLGAQFLVLKSVADASGTGGYARQLTPEEQAAQQDELNGFIAGMDVVITTAQVPGRRPPLLVTAKGGRGHEARLRDRRHGGVRAGRQRRAVQARRDRRHAKRRHDPCAHEPAGDHAGRREPVLRAQPVHVRPPFHEGRRDGLRPGRRDPGGHGHHPRRRSRAGGDAQAPPAPAATEAPK